MKFNEEQEQANCLDLLRSIQRDINMAIAVAETCTFRESSPEGKYQEIETEPGAIIIGNWLIHKIRTYGTDTQAEIYQDPGPPGGP